MNLKELLGTNYKEGLTEDEIGKIVGTILNGKDVELEKYKKTSESNASEASEWKKKYQEKLTDEEKAKLQYEEIVKRNQELEKNAKVASFKAEYIRIGYGDDLAKETAEAMANGDMVKVLANQKLYNDELKKNYEIEKLEKTPQPPAGDKKTITKDEFLKMSCSELNELYEKDPNTFKTLANS